MERVLVRNDTALRDFVDKNALEPLFTTLADKCLKDAGAVLTMINPTAALCAPSALEKRRILSQRFHIHTVLTCHQPGQTNMSQNTSINESIIVAKKSSGTKPATRFITLDRMPSDDSEVHDMHKALLECQEGLMKDGWGVVSHWPTERIESGDWTPAIWRSPELGEAASKFANDSALTAIKDISGVFIHSTYQTLLSNFSKCDAGEPGAFPVLASKGAKGQSRITSTPDEYRTPKKTDEETVRLNGGIHPETKRMLEKTSHLQITQGQRNNTSCLTATASDHKYVGIGYLPVTGLTAEQSKGTAVFINSTPGRLQLMCNAGRTLEFPLYNPAASGNIRIPDVHDTRIRQILSDCWERTKEMKVPQFRDGECEVRRLWDEAVAEAMGWDATELSRLRHLLHQEPHVSGLGYGQYADELEEVTEEQDEFDIENDEL